MPWCRSLPCAGTCLCLHHWTACQPCFQPPGPSSLCLSAFSGCQTLLCPCAGQARRAGEFVPPPRSFPQSVNDDSCQINTPTPLFSKWKNSDTFFMDTQSYLLGSIKPQFAHSRNVLDEAITTGLLPFSVLFLHSPTSAFWDHLSNTLFGLFEVLFLGEPNLRKP